MAAGSLPQLSDVALTFDGALLLGGVDLTVSEGQRGASSPLVFSAISCVTCCATSNPRRAGESPGRAALSVGTRGSRG